MTKERPILFSGPMVRAILEGRKTQTRRVVKPQPQESFAVDYNKDGDVNERRSYGWSWQRSPMHGHLDCPNEMITLCPYGQPGDRLWVRETWQMVDQDGEADASSLLRERLGSTAPFRGVQGDRPITWRAVYRADGEAEHPTYGPINWRPSIHMPRWASRLALEVTVVRVERLQEISEEDAKAEGARFFPDIPLGRGSVYPPLPRWSMFDPADTDQCLGTARFAFGNAWNKTYAKRGLGWDTNPWVWVVEFKKVEED